MLPTSSASLRGPGHRGQGITLGLPRAGLPRTADDLLAFRLAYDVTVGWPTEWGDVDGFRNADGQHDDLN